MAVKSKFVQISKDIINIWANTEPTQAEDDDGAVNWFIVNRTVFSDTSSGEQFQNRHWTEIQKYPGQSYVPKTGQAGASIRSLSLRLSVAPGNAIQMTKLYMTALASQILWSSTSLWPMFLSISDTTMWLWGPVRRSTWSLPTQLSGILRSGSV